jgi:hypothetical protein
MKEICRIWYGERFDFEPEQSFDFEFKNVVSSLPARIRIATGAVADNATSMSFSVNGQTIGSSNLSGIGNQNIRAASRATFLNNSTNLS